MLFNRPAVGYRHQVAAWSSLGRQCRFHIRADWARWLKCRALRRLRRLSLKFRRIGLPFVCNSPQERDLLFRQLGIRRRPHAT
jgi:hypothetical protein